MASIFMVKEWAEQDTSMALQPRKPQSEFGMLRGACKQARGMYVQAVFLAQASGLDVRRIMRRSIRDSSVGIATGYGLDDRGVGVRVQVGSRIFSSPSRPDRLWGPPSYLYNGYQGLFPRE
jgi:hypothetical protein